MSKIFDELREEARKEAIIEITEKLLLDNSLTIQQISEISGLSIDEIEKLKLSLGN